ncbi:zinc finger, c2h2 [Trichoderma arundinaceum]|uniref:Zinc finger, c2h2 n=1 Tax=Trichoderma arundinaceum TaxID=490622 RepID=A0A395NBN1_TRIAR|nr:zinc finger, c2h2 [Trichoderma arundinaceum]
MSANNNNNNNNTNPSSSSSLTSFPTASVENGRRVVYGYDQVSAGYSVTSVSLPTHGRGGHFYEPIDPELVGDSSSSDGSQQYWPAQEVSYFQQAPGEPCLDPSLVPDASSSRIYQAAYGRNSSPFSLEPSPSFPLIENSPSIGSDSAYDMMMDPATPPDAQGSVISLGSPYDSDGSYASNGGEPSEMIYYPGPQDEGIGRATNSAYFGVDMVAVSDHYAFNAIPGSSPLGLIGGTHGGHYPLRTTLPYVGPVRHIKEESPLPDAEAKISAARVPRRRASGKRPSPDHDGPPRIEKKKPRLQATNKKFCHKCKKNFSSRSSLEAHTGLEHPRPYICVFHYAGCTARFDAKNEWKRHVSTKHLGLKYWVCTEGKCADERQSAFQRQAGLPSNGNIFNRKDLYTQHIRRMHFNITGQSTTDYKGADARSDGMVKQMQEEALRVRCKLPTWMPCPVQSCDKEFVGSNAWDERMEHVAQQHFDNAAAGRELPVRFGGLHDNVLTQWAQRPDIRIVKRAETGWELCDPLKGDAEYRMASPDGGEE